MVINKIRFAKKFFKQLRKLPQEIVTLSEQKIDLFIDNPLHPSLRLHELHGDLRGAWSITINKNYRLIFERDNDSNIFFISIGKHDLYKNL